MVVYKARGARVNSVLHVKHKTSLAPAPNTIWGWCETNIRRALLISDLLTLAYRTSSDLAPEEECQGQ